MPTTKKLPLKLSATAIDPALLNEQMKRGEIVLDWSQVVEAPDEILMELLAGLDLHEDSAKFGMESVPDALAKQFMTALSKTPKVTPAPVSNGAKLAQPAPAVWQPPVSSPAVSLLSEEAGTPVASNEPTLVAKSATILESVTAYQVREELEEMVLKDLLGPVAGPTEELDERARDRYLIGLLAPGKLQDDPDPDEHLDPSEQEELSSVETGKSGEDGSTDAASQQVITFCPSSLGLSFMLDATATRLRIMARWGHYQRVYSEQSTRKDGGPKMVWKRSPRQGVKVIDLQEGNIVEWRPEPAEQPDVVVRGVIRRQRLEDSSGNRRATAKKVGWSVTLFLVNKQYEPPKNRDSAWLFQPELVIEAPDGAAIFERRTPPPKNYLENPDMAEKRAMEMLYRKRVNFAAGHGVSVHAETLPGDTTRAVRLSTRVAPSYEVARTDHLGVNDEPLLAGLVLEMKELAGLEQTALATRLNPLVTAYRNWIEQQTRRLAAEGDLTFYQKQAQQALAKAEITLKRIQDGIELVATNPQAAQAFRFMNEAMHRQFVRSRVAEAKRQGNSVKPEDVAAPKWRLFQLGFILLNLPSLTDLSHPDRSTDAGAVADLLWFPTGGGKTEAYLGLTAYTLAIRRLQGTVNGRVGEEGVAVIMRYTLRLLTFQQFQRAAALICACEMLRREAIEQGDFSLGKIPFRLGLWVGQRATPNTTAASAEALNQEGGHSSVVGGTGTPNQLTNCPWCGNSVKARVETFAKGRGRTLMYCEDAYGSCPFTLRKSASEGLPVLVVDEEIYRFLPALLIATVDKFAQMPWKGATQLLFGQVQKKCERHGFVYPDPPSDAKEPLYHPAKPGLPAAKVESHPALRPPDLIIQDELHLISGPLGTLVGLYETAVDHLSSWQLADTRVVRPKVIAATATIRRAERQIQALFLRQVNIFPPPGLDITDNFFARQTEPSESTPGRRYLGICASGRRLKAALIRVYVAYLSASQALYEKYGEKADPYMTLVGYFNALSDLGGTRRLVEDDVRSRLLQMDKRGLAVRKNLLLDELTSRKSQNDIKGLLDKLERKFDPAEREKNERDNWQKRPLDVLLATNMISVGVDVPRLGLMVVTGQPKNTAEYIQATSRVGRREPGLVCVVYNWARPRDLSHYEQFEHYHATYYQYVEALSVTPFAARAIDRGLSALLVSYIRLSGPDYSENEKAGAFKTTNPEFTQALERITRRAAQVKDQPASTLIKARLTELGKYWQEATEVKGRTLGYNKDGGTVVGLLEQPGKGEWKYFTCLNSLRDVEPTVKLILDERGVEPVTISLSAEQHETAKGENT